MENKDGGYYYCLLKSLPSICTFESREPRNRYAPHYTARQIFKVPKPMLRVIIPQPTLHPYIWYWVL